MPRARRSMSAVALLPLIAAAVVPSAPLTAAGASSHGTTDPAVRPVDWAGFDAGEPDSPDAERARQILLNANRYALQTWYPAAYGGQTGAYLDLGGVGEHDIRPPGSEALALATSLSTGAYDAQVTGLPHDEALEVTVRLVSSIAHHHLANGEAGWGDEWQSALWAYYAGYAGWLLWEHLEPTDREKVRRMIEHEADRFIDYPVPYFRDADGNVVHPGDSKAEENAWNANLLQLATAMMPAHAHQGLWMDKNLELMVSAFSRPADLAGTEMVNGRRVRDWLNGSNIADDGTLVNHGFIHPDYMATLIHNTNAVLSYGMANMPTPEAALFNADVVYDAMVDHEFASPPYQAPGGTIYRDGSSELYYPQGNDWGTHRRMHVALVDAQAAAFGFDGQASTPGSVWEPLHASMVLEMQARFDDGRTYGAPSEDTYAGREQWVAAHAAQTWLTHWIMHQDAFRITERAYPPRAEARGTVKVAGPGLVEPGGDGTVTVTFGNRSDAPATSVELSLSVPSGWNAEAVTARSAPMVRVGGSFTATWSIEAPADAPPGRVDLHAGAAFRAFGQSLEAEGSTSITVPPSPPEGIAYLSDHPWVDAYVGYPRDDGARPLRDRNLYGDRLAIEGTVFEHGLFAHAVSSITFHLGGDCTRLTAAVGIDDAVEADGAERGSVEFRALADGRVVYDSGVVRGDMAAQPVDVDLTGVRELELVATDGGDGISHDHAVWAKPVVTCAD